jgi:hypothetical protein
MIHLLLFKYGSCQDDPLAALFDSCSQEQRAQVLFRSAGILSSAPISLLLQPCTSNFKTC